MSAFHVLAAILATWRLTDLVTQDRITEPIRRRWPVYLWTCPRCCSVWAGGAVTIAFVISPWLNWPLALAWLYLWKWETWNARQEGRAASPCATENAVLRAELSRARSAILTRAA